MPRKKPAPTDTSSPSQPMKKMRTRSASGTETQANHDDSSPRRTRSNRLQDENQQEAGVSPNSLKSTRSHKHLEEVNNSQKEPNAMSKPCSDNSSVSHRGAGFVVEKTIPKKLSIPSSPLHSSVQVTAAELVPRTDKGVSNLGTSTESKCRKRKGKLTPETQDKRVRQVISHSTTPLSASDISQALANRQPESPTLGEVTAPPRDSTLLNTVIAVPDLPSELPAVDRDPLLNRPRIKACDKWAQSVDLTQTFSVLTYNILAECHRVKGDYSYTAETHLCMPYRHSRIMQEVEALHADVVCMQEVDVPYYEDTLQKAMSRLGYKSIIHKRKGDNYPEGEVTFYRANNFLLLDNKKVNYADLAQQDIDRLEYDNETKECIQKHTDREAVLLMTKLLHKASKQVLVIGNTHISWTWFKELDIPCMQTAYAMKTMVQYADGGESPFVLVGDFNSRITDPAYQLACDGYLNDQSIKKLQSLRTVTFPDHSSRPLIDILWHAFQHPARGVASSYKHCQGEEPKVTSRNCVMNNGVDYMWSYKVHPVDIDVVNEANHGLPNIIFPSDHLSLRGTYTF